MMKSPTTSNGKKIASQRNRRGRWRKPLLFVLCALMLAAIAAGLWPRPIQVETSSVTRGPLTVSVLEEGKTRIRHRHVISPPVAGFLNRVELREGAPIRAGQTVLAVIEPQSSGFLDPRRLAEAKARVKAAEAAGKQRHAEAARTRTALDLAQSDFARADELYQGDVIPRQQWETAENRVRILSHELDSAEFALRIAEFELEQARAAMVQLESPESGQYRPLRYSGAGRRLCPQCFRGKCPCRDAR
ncbi:MAG: efflux RND transporter periplasmic adaptor subunit [Desulfobacterales bacterium]